MPFINFYDSFIFNRKFKHCNDITGYELTSNGTANQLGIFFGTQG